MAEGISLKTLDSKEHATPEWIIRKLRNDIGGDFDLDPAATPGNAKAPLYYTEEDNGLVKHWDICNPSTTFVFCNPPYGREVGKWVRKAFRETDREVISYLLLKVSSDTDWWHDYVLRADEIRFIHHRVKYEGVSEGPAPFPSCIVVFRPEKLMISRE
ncbi:MAG: hypothetical protein GX465_15410, partial [Acidobacteria bacterium]|nr:hypothetical protein [Acidobacteriota bacterium]